MLIKEYRIPLPLTVEEYRIAQLYMIAKKSREESHGVGSGVEIIVNEPYENGPGGKGQYTKKIYHIGSHLPGWIKSLLPKSALTVEEEAWNAYPFTKTRYTCPFVEKFLLDIETYYFPDNGFQENVFGLSGNDLRNRVVDLIDIVRDQLTGSDYFRDEDPTLFVSEKTGRGPLDNDWLEKYWNEVKEKMQPTAKNMSLMCAYKLCRVEFRYWGMQTKLEKFIHDVALRKTMLRAHRQAWAWQDEWHGLTMDAIREIERQTQMALAKKMGMDSSDSEDNEIYSHGENKIIDKVTEREKAAESKGNFRKHSLDSPFNTTNKMLERQENYSETYEGKRKAHKYADTQISPRGSINSFDIQVANWRMEKLEVDSNSGSEEEYYDCVDITEAESLIKWTSVELLTAEDESPTSDNNEGSQGQMLKSSSAQRRNQELSLDLLKSSTSSTTILLLVIHGGSVLDAGNDINSKKSDINTFRGAFESVMRQHYRSLLTHIKIKLVACPPICSNILRTLSNLSPYSFNYHHSVAEIPNITDVPVGAIPLLIITLPEFEELLNGTITSANTEFQQFLNSEEGIGFSGQIALVADSVGAILAYFALCRSSHYLHNIQNINEQKSQNETYSNATLSEHRTSEGNDMESLKFDFEVADFFIFGSPLSVVLASKKLKEQKLGVCRPMCQQVYNLFHPTDPMASRLEPLISGQFSSIMPVNMPRYTKNPLGNGQSNYIFDFIQSNPQCFSENAEENVRRYSDVSIQSTVSGFAENVSFSTFNNLQHKWWGAKRLDYAVYCPEGLNDFPSHALPHLFHASYWESADVISFILRQLGRFELQNINTYHEQENKIFRPQEIREKWMKKRTSVKLKNVAANHRANDIIIKEGREQKICARFMYGPLDMITLTGEKVDIHIMKDPPAGHWTLLSTEVTDKNGRIIYILPDEKKLSYGIYPLKMTVRGDHTTVDFYMAVIPPRTECVVFSIDGSFTASVSVTGRDPKVRAGAVDVCRHWQDLGYLLLYITGRPDMQQQRVVSWLSQHNFPHGLISFADGLSTDPLGHKTAYLNDLIRNHEVIIHTAYGSSKDISVYTNIGLKPQQIFIIGKVNKKLQSSATVLAEGYASHLTLLLSVGGSRPAQGNARMVIPRGCLSIASQPTSSRRRKQIQRPGSTHSKYMDNKDET